MSADAVILEEDPIIGLDLEILCADAGWTVRRVAQRVDRVLPDARNCDLLVTDMGLGPDFDGDGVDVIDLVRQDNPCVAVIVVSGTCCPHMCGRIAGALPVAHVCKPFSTRTMRAALARARADPA